MKLVLSVNGVDVLLTPSKADAIMEILWECERVTHEWVSADKNYRDSIENLNVRADIKMSPMTETEYEAMKFIQKNQSA